MDNTKIEPLVEAVKAAPPVSIVGLQLAGITLNEWVLLGSMFLIVLQVIFLLRKEVYLPWKAKRGL